MSVFSLEEDDYGDIFITQNCSQPEDICEMLETNSQEDFQGARFGAHPPVYEDISDDDDFERRTFFIFAENRLVEHMIFFRLIFITIYDLSKNELLKRLKHFEISLFSTPYIFTNIIFSVQTSLDARNLINYFYHCLLQLPRENLPLLLKRRYPNFRKYS